MLQQPIFSLFIRLIPETFLILYAICVFANSKPDLNRILVSSLIGGSAVYVLRLLPIHFGVHTILGIMIDIVLAVKVNNIEIHKAITAALTSVILLFTSDLILVVGYNALNYTSLLSGQTMISVIAGIPSLLLFYLIVRMIIYFKIKRNKNGQN